MHGFQLESGALVDARRPAEQLGYRTLHQGQRRAELVTDVGEERRLGPIQFGELLGSALLGPKTARAADRRRHVAGDQLYERPIIVIEYPVAVERGDQEAVGRTAL